MKALEKSTEQVFLLRTKDRIKNSQTVLKATTGAKVSSTDSWRLPQTVYLALNFLIVPSGARFLLKTQCPGKSFWPLAAEVRTSIQDLCFSRAQISSVAAFIQTSLLSLIALSKFSVSGSFLPRAGKQYFFSWVPQAAKRTEKWLGGGQVAEMAHELKYFE